MLSVICNVGDRPARLKVDSGAPHVLKLPLAEDLEGLGLLLELERSLEDGALRLLGLALPDEKAVLVSTSIFLRFLAILTIRSSICFTL